MLGTALFAFFGVPAAEPLVEVVQPLRSAALHHFLSWEDMLIVAQAGLRESLEIQLHDATSQLRKAVFDAQGQVWASASIPQLQQQVNLSRWPDGDLLLRQAAHPESLQDIGVVLNMMQHLFHTFEDHLSEMKISVERLENEMEAQAHHFGVNLDIVLKQAGVLLGLLQGLPNFSECLFQSLAEARDRRPADDSYVRSLLYLQRMATGQPRDGTGLLVRLSTFAGEDFDPEGSFGERLRAMLLQNQEMINSVKASEASPELDWCAGTYQLWKTAGPNPCQVVKQELEDLLGKLTDWVLAGQPQRMLRQIRRRQFAMAPNISRVEVLSKLLQRSAELCLHGDLATPRSSELKKVLQDVVNDEEINVQKEHDLLAEAVQSQFGSAGLDSHDLERPGLLGLLRKCLETQWIFEAGLLAVATWGDRIKRRGNGLQNRLARVKATMEAVHDQLRSLPSFRRLAFEEIHAAGHWGRRASGGGSSVEATRTAAQHLLQFLNGQRGQGSKLESMIDIGCGWGEWIPDALLNGVEDGRLPETFRYLGVDIAWQPIKHLKQLHKHRTWAPELNFRVFDGVQDELPTGYGLALVRHVFQHLSLQDALNLLRNVRRAADFVVLSSWPESENEDLEDFGGSSAYAAMEPSLLKNFKSYDLRKKPFLLPEPLTSWPETTGRGLMLAYRASSLGHL